jgi:hypothetical protein
MPEDLAEVHTKSPAYEIGNRMIAKQGSNIPYAGGRSWSSTENFIPNLTPQGEIKGNLETDENVAAALSLQLADRMKGIFPDKVLYDLLAWNQTKKQNLTLPKSQNEKLAQV